MDGGEIGDLYAPAKLAIRSFPDLENVTGPVRLGQKVYLFSYLEDNDVYSSLLIEKCTATDPDHNKTITIVDDSCPVPKVRDLFFAQPGYETSLGKDGIGMLMQIFKMVQTTTTVNFACEVKVCRNDTNCELPYCPGFSRKKRDLSSNVIVQAEESNSLVDRQKRQAVDTDVILNDKVIVKYSVQIEEQDGLDEDTDDIDIITVSGADDRLSKDETEDTVIIIGAIVGSVCLLALTAAIIFIAYKRRTRAFKSDKVFEVNDQMYPWGQIPHTRHDQHT